MVTLWQDSFQVIIWICSCMKVNFIMLGIIITWLLFSCWHMKIQASVTLRRDGSWLQFWVFNLRSKRESLGLGMVLHDFYPSIHETESYIMVKTSCSKRTQHTKDVSTMGWAARTEGELECSWSEHRVIQRTELEKRPNVFGGTEMIMCESRTLKEEAVILNLSWRPQHFEMLELCDTCSGME